VQNFYQSFLGRPADNSGLQNFVSALQQRVREETVILNLTGSDEYFIRLQTD